MWGKPLWRCWRRSELCGVCGRDRCVPALCRSNGQFEASASLGLNYPKTLLSVILPQAFKNVLPALANECIVLLKETSVAGYIAVIDLTKGGDIIRSQTYSALFPLLVVAAIYLVIVCFLTYLVGRLERRLRTNERNVMKCFWMYRDLKRPMAAIRFSTGSPHRSAEVK